MQKSGKLTKEQYANYLTMQIDKDTILYSYLQKKQFIEEMEIVKARIQIMKKEISECQ